MKPVVDGLEGSIRAQVSKEKGLLVFGDEFTVSMIQPRESRGGLGGELSAILDGELEAIRKLGDASGVADGLLRRDNAETFQ